MDTAKGRGEKGTQKGSTCLQAVHVERGGAEDRAREKEIEI